MYYLNNSYEGETIKELVNRVAIHLASQGQTDIDVKSFHYCNGERDLEFTAKACRMLEGYISDEACRLLDMQEDEARHIEIESYLIRRAQWL